MSLRAKYLKMCDGKGIDEYSTLRKFKGTEAGFQVLERGRLRERENVYCSHRVFLLYWFFWEQPGLYRGSLINTASGLDSVVVGGQGNTASGNYDIRPCSSPECP